jgi:hypothetical protein
MDFDTPDFSDLGPEVEEASEGEPVRQFAIFLQNKVGELASLVKMLGDHHIIVLGLSVQDASDYAIVRLVVSDPDSTRELFQEHGVAHSMIDLVVVEMKDGVSCLSKLLGCVLASEVNIHFSYPLLVRPDDKAVLAMHVEDVECATVSLRGGGFRTLTQADISR